MSEVVRLTPVQVRNLRKGAPSAHLLDEVDGSVHLGLVADGELIGVISAFRERPPGSDHRRRDLQVYGPFGQGGATLIDALVEEVGPGARLWADSERPTLEAGPNGVWHRSTGELAPPAFGPYPAFHLQVLEGRECIRRRPGMYIGGTGAEGVRYLVYELVGNVVDQHLLGRAGRLDVRSDGVGVSVSDDGPGLPPEVLTLACTQLHAGATADGPRPHVHVTALNGIGLTAVNALSSALVVTVERDGRRWQQIFERGRPLTQVRDLGATSRSGSSFWFTPDPAIIPDPTVDLGPLRACFQELAYLNPGLCITVDGERLDGGEGLSSLAERLVGSAVTRRLVASGTHDGVRVQVAVAWGAGASVTRGWANQLPSTGSHVEGLTAGLRPLPAEGRVALVAVDLQHPHYAGRTREQLQCDAARAAVERIVAEAVR